MKSVADYSTEEKILQAARNVFIQKGFAATRTRHIAQEAGINIAALNYYFRSKKKLFDLVMQEQWTTFLDTVEPVINDQSISLLQKLELLIIHLTDVLLAQPNLPLFLINESTNNAQSAPANVRFTQLLLDSHLASQLQAERPDINPLQFILNLFGLTVFPFINKPMIEEAMVDGKEFVHLVEQRKALIPQWIIAMLHFSA